MWVRFFAKPEGHRSGLSVFLPALTAITYKGPASPYRIMRADDRLTARIRPLALCTISELAAGRGRVHALFATTTSNMTMVLCSEAVAFEIFDFARVFKAERLIHKKNI